MIGKILILFPIFASFFFFVILERNFSESYPGSSGCFAERFNTKTLGQFEPAPAGAFFNGKEIPSLKFDLAAKLDQTSKILATHITATGAEKWIEIDLSEQKIRAWEGNRQVMEFVISSGKRLTPTPDGEFRIWVKLRYTKMEGGVRGTSDYYYLPNVPYVMYFYKGYGIHGAYWHMNFGTPVSHGCVNLQIPDAGQLFNWAAPLTPAGKSVGFATNENPGTRVVVHN